MGYEGFSEISNAKPPTYKMKYDGIINIQAYIVS